MHTRFSPHSLTEIFRDLYLGERTGILTLEQDDGVRRFHFERGLITFADSTSEAERLGRVLTNEGAVSAGALKEAGTDAEPAQLAQSLLNRGLIGTAALQRSLRELSDRIVGAAFAGPGGQAEFHETDTAPSFYDSDVLSTFEQILGGIERMADFDLVREALDGLDNRLRMRRPAPIPLERLTLSRTQGFVVSRVDGTSTFSGVISTLPPGEDEHASRFLFGLLVMGVIDYDPPVADGPFRAANILRDHADRRALDELQARTIQQAYARMRNQSAHEVLGVTSHASRRAIERAYEEAKTLFSRERLLPRVRERYRSELGVIESRLIEAYLQLTRPETATNPSRREEDARREDVSVDDLLVRPELDKTQARAALDEAGRVAELYYSKARQSMRSGDYHNAIQYGKLAISYNGEDARFYFTLADCQARNPEARWQRMAEQNYTKATQLDPWNAEYLISLGRFYKKRGLHLRARRQFEEALKLVPEHEVATRELQSLGKR
jgi:tetratricopeptide (TPR) repeat protein